MEVDSDTFRILIYKTLCDTETAVQGLLCARHVNYLAYSSLQSHSIAPHFPRHIRKIQRGRIMALRQNSRSACTSAKTTSAKEQELGPVSDSANLLYNTDGLQSFSESTLSSPVPRPFLQTHPSLLPFQIPQRRRGSCEKEDTEGLKVKAEALSPDSFSLEVQNLVSPLHLDKPEVKQD